MRRRRLPAPKASGKVGAVLDASHQPGCRLGVAAPRHDEQARRRPAGSDAQRRVELHDACSVPPRSSAVGAGRPAAGLAPGSGWPFSSTGRALPCEVHGVVVLLAAAGRTASSSGRAGDAASNRMAGGHDSGGPGAGRCAAGARARRNVGAVELRLLGPARAPATRSTHGRPAVTLRTYTYLDVLQPQLASFLATVAQGYLPIEEQAALMVEVQPGIAINRITDVALKNASRDAGHADRRARLRHARAALRRPGRSARGGRGHPAPPGPHGEDRLTPAVVTSEIITGTDAYQTMLINRMRHGDCILKGQSLYIMETHPAGYALLCANEAEKAAPIRLLEVVSFGAYGRLYLGGGDDEIKEAARAAEACLQRVKGRPNEEVVDVR